MRTVHSATSESGRFASTAFTLVKVDAARVKRPHMKISSGRGARTASTFAKVDAVLAHRPLLVQIRPFAGNEGQNETLPQGFDRRVPILYFSPTAYASAYELRVLL